MKLENNVINGEKASVIHISKNIIISYEDGSKLPFIE